MKKILPVIISLLITNAVFAQLPVTGLVAWYPFCNDITDHSGNGYDLANSGTATNTIDRFGNVNDAIYLNGGTSSELSYSAPFPSTGDFTYTCWINAASAQTSVIWYNGNPTSDGFGIYMNNGTLGTAGTNVEVVFGGAIGQFLSTPITLNVWHELYLSKSGGGFRFTIDGQPAGLGFFVPSPSYATPTGLFTIGQDYSAVTPGSAAFDGEIDDVAIYNRFVTGIDTVHLNHFNPDIDTFNLGILLTNPDTGICGNSITLTPSPYFDTSMYHYSWNTGATTISITVPVSPEPGNYYTLTLSKPYGCILAESAHIHRTVVGLTLGPRNTVFCAATGVADTLNPNPVAGETFLWSTGATTGTLAIDTSGTYWVTVDSAGGCYGSDTITVNVHPKILVNIGPDTNSCNGSPITLHSTYTYPATSTYQWSGIFPLVGATTLPVYTTSVSGTFWLSVTDSGCVGTDTAVIGVVFDSLVLTTPDTTICKGGFVQIRAHGNPLATDAWTPTEGIASGFSVNPIITPDTSAWYSVTATLDGCHVKDSLYITVQPVPTVYIGGNRNVCRGDTLHITALVTPTWFTHYIYNWTPGVNLDHSVTTTTDSTLGTVIFTAGDTTDLILKVTTPGDSSCFGIDSAELLVHTPVRTTLTDSFLCPGDSLVLNPHPVAGDFYVWHPGTYLSDSTAAQPVVKPINDEQYWIQSTDRFGCHDTAFENIKVFPNAVIYLGDSVTIYPGQSYQISPQTNCVAFSWKPPLGLSDTSVANPIASPAVSTKYIVKASTEWGCKTTDSINFHVDPSALVALPNAFTPGTNGINNYFTILSRGIVEIHYFRVFNRWGNKLFETNNINTGWDGTFNGKPQPFDVYVYDVEAATNEGVIFHTTGNVTLIR
jgi:gliding motility-associated-like protein